jgi:hypothetical protein
MREVINFKENSSTQIILNGEIDEFINLHFENLKEILLGNLNNF